MSTAPSTSSSEHGAAPAPPRPGALARWIPVVLWATCISWFSTGAFSAQSTNSYIDPFLRRLFGELTSEGFRLAHTIIRKSAHFTEYAVLAVLMVRALTSPGAPVPVGIVARTLVYCTLYAAADEIHQVFVPSRTGSPTDVLVDAAGVVMGAVLLAGMRARRRATARARAAPLGGTVD